MTKLSLRDFALAIALLIICVFFAWASPDFHSARNLSLLMIELSITATLALGMLLVILPGHIDLSAGSGVGLIGGIAAVLVTGGALPAEALTALQRTAVSLFGPGATGWIAPPPWPAPAAMLFALAAAIVLWWLMGNLIVRERIPAFIITLGGLLVFKGLFWLVIQYHTVPVVAAVGAGTIKTISLSIAGWRCPIWEVVSEESGSFTLNALPAGQRWPVLHGNGNLYSALTTSYLTPVAGYALAAAIVLGLVSLHLRGLRQRRAFGLGAEDGELAFLQLFLAAQFIFLFVIVTNQYRGVPLPALILAAVATAVWVLTQHTPFGRYLYAIGGNEEAAIVSGIPVKRVTIGAFTLMGVIVAITGFMQTATGGNSTTTVGDLMELDAVAACVIGGVSLKGGRGTVLGVLFGALIMACLINGMTLLSVKPAQTFVARGAVLILAVWMDVRLASRS